MLAINHALTGAIIGATFQSPLLAIGAAFMSHFVCDAIPHYGSSVPLRSAAFKRLLVADAVLCVLLVLILGGVGINRWMLVSLCAFLATSPDLLWVRRFIREQQPGQPKFKENRLERVLGGQGIQWFQRPIGALVEAAWAAGAIIILYGVVTA